MMKIRIGLTAAVFAAVAVSASSMPSEKPADPAVAIVAKDPGKQVFNKWCVECHGDGPRYPGTASLAVKYGKDLPAALEKREDFTPEVVAMFVRQGASIMPPFRKTEITDSQLASLGAYLSHQPDPKTKSGR